MLKKISINYNVVYAKTTELRNSIKSIIERADEEYRQIQLMLDNVDGATAAVLKETMESNRKKTLVTAKTLDKMLSFMHNSSKQVETTELNLAKVYEVQNRIMNKTQA